MFLLMHWSVSFVTVTISRHKLLKWLIIMGSRLMYEPALNGTYSVLKFTQGNLLDSDAEALVNTVNTVGVMGTGIALMFKEQFKENFQKYKEACDSKQLEVGSIFVTQPNSFIGPKWIVNFPTKKHWKDSSKVEWIRDGLIELREFLQVNSVKSVAIPPLGAGNGGLEWNLVKPLIVHALEGLGETEVIIFEPTERYRNHQKGIGVEKLTPARALIAELIRKYWVLGMECSLLEIQKLAWFAERVIEESPVSNPLKLEFTADRYGPYASRLIHLLNALDGSYLHCEKRISDAGPLDVIWFDESKRSELVNYLSNPEFEAYRPALEKVLFLIDGFESPFAIELLATVDWLLSREDKSPTLGSIREGLRTWPKGGERKLRIFDDRSIEVALSRLAPAT